MLEPIEGAWTEGTLVRSRDGTIGVLRSLGCTGRWHVGCWMNGYVDAEAAQAMLVMRELMTNLAMAVTAKASWTSSRSLGR